MILKLREKEVTTIEITGRRNVKTLFEDIAICSSSSIRRK